MTGKYQKWMAICLAATLFSTSLWTANPLVSLAAEDVSDEEPVEEDAIDDLGEDISDVEESDTDAVDEDETIAEEETADALMDNENSGTCGVDLTWELSANGILTISGNGDMYDYTRSDGAPWKGKRIEVVEIAEGVTSIGEFAFSFEYEYDEANTWRIDNDIVRVNLPSSLRTIGRFAFYTCEKLTDITLPDNLTDIDDFAFFECISLKKIQIPSKMTTIKWATFSDCENLVDISLPDGLKEIGGGAFSGCGMSSIEIPDSVQSIGVGAFDSCKNLSYIEIPDGVLSIEQGAFSDCPSLSRVELPDSLQNLELGTFGWCTALSSIAIPSSLNAVSDSLFAGCSNLRTVILPASITSIGREIFSGCKVLSDIYYAGDESHWSDIHIGYGNDVLGKVAIHYNSSGPGNGENIAEADITLAATKYTYDGKAKRPDASVNINGTTLQRGTDFSVTYDNNVEIGTATATITGKSGYTGSVVKEFSIVQAQDISGAVVKLDAASYVFNGTPIVPAVSVKWGDVTLTEKTDYTISYSGNNAVGTATITVMGTGDYTGKATGSFSITKGAQTIKKATAGSVVSGKTTKANVSGTNLFGAAVYTSLNKSVATVNASTGVITGKTPGKAKITVYFKETNNYTKSKTAAFTITVTKPAKTSLSVSAKKGGFAASWGKKICNGYILEWALDKNFKKGKQSKQIKNADTTKYPVTGLKKGKTYFVRVYTYGSNKNIKSTASAVKKVKIK